MFRSIVRVVFFCAVIWSFAVPAFGWDETGHKIVAYIAWQQMTPAARIQAVQILLSAPEDAQLSTFYISYGSRSDEARRREFFVFSATWADLIRDKGFNTRYTKYNNPTWHYFDTLWTVKDGKVVFLPAIEEGGHLMEKLADFDKVIRSSASNQDKAIAVAWLEHLIGDLHQPLHTAARSGDDGKGDQGGNKFPLKSASGSKSNLHSFWDGIIGQTSPNTTDACDADYIDPIAQSIMKELPYSKLQNRIAGGKYDVWEKESVEIATTEVYKDVKRNEIPSDKYKRKALSIARERMALAGYRLGDLFNEAFGGHSARLVPCESSPSIYQ